MASATERIVQRGKSRRSGPRRNAEDTQGPIRCTVRESGTRGFVCQEREQNERNSISRLPR